MKSLKAIAATLPLLLLFGCSNPADDVPAASVGSNATANTDAVAKPDAGGRSYVFGPGSSTISFIGSKVTGRHNGGFRNFAGEFKVINGRLADSGNKVVIDASSLWSDNNRLTGHLKSPDFFHVAQYPTATFVSTSVNQTSDNATVTGDLTLHGITKSISFPAKIQVAEEAVNVTAEFHLNRFDFEMKYPGKADDLIRKEVILKLNVKAAPGNADFEAVEQAAKTAAAAAPARPAGPRASGQRPAAPR
jgi:polyisoprenoid-binding protein YceI